MLTLDSGACNTIPFSALGDPRAVREGSKRYVRLPSGKVARVISLNGIWVAEMGMLEYTTQSLPPVTGLPEGTEVFVGNYNGNIARLINGVWRYISPFIVAWASRPAANAVPVGTELQVTDYGNQKWVSDGTYWRPAQGRVLLTQKVGSLTAPIAAIQSVSGVFAIPGGGPLIPVGMLVPNSKLGIQAEMRKTTGAGTFTANIWIGTAGATTDRTVLASASPATANTDALLTTSIKISDVPTRFIARNWMGDGSTSSSNTGVISEANSGGFDTRLDMRVSFGNSAANATDNLVLLSYLVWLEA